MLSDVLVDEVDGLKKELRSQKQDLKAVVKARTSQMQWTTSVQREMSDLRASLEKDLTVGLARSWHFSQRYFAVKTHDYYVPPLDHHSTPHIPQVPPRGTNKNTFN